MVMWTESDNRLPPPRHLKDSVLAIPPIQRASGASPSQGSGIAQVLRSLYLALGKERNTLTVSWFGCAHCVSFCLSACLFRVPGSMS